MGVSESRCAEVGSLVSIYLACGQILLILSDLASDHNRDDLGGASDTKYPATWMRMSLRVLRRKPSQRITVLGLDMMLTVISLVRDLPNTNMASTWTTDSAQVCLLMNTEAVDQECRNDAETKLHTHTNRGEYSNNGS